MRLPISCKIQKEKKDLKHECINNEQISNNYAMLLRGYSPGMCRLEMVCTLVVLAVLSTGRGDGVATGVSAINEASSLAGTGASIS